MAHKKAGQNEGSGGAPEPGQPGRRAGQNKIMNTFLKLVGMALIIAVILGGVALRVKYESEGKTQIVYVTNFMQGAELSNAQSNKIWELVFKARSAKAAFEAQTMADYEFEMDHLIGALNALGVPVNRDTLKNDDKPDWRDEATRERDIREWDEYKKKEILKTFERLNRMFKNQGGTNSPHWP